MPEKFKQVYDYLLKLLNTVFSPYIKKVQGLLNKKFNFKTFLTKQGAALQALLIAKPSKKEDYLTFKRHYVAKKLIVIIVILCIVTPYAFYTYALPFIVQKFGTATFIEASKQIEGYNGKVKIITGQKNKNEKPVCIFKGKLQDGKRQGEGELYDEKGNLIYKGNFLDDRYNGQGSLYAENGQTIYEGTFSGGKEDGSGVEYYPNENKKYDGTFKNGYYEGNGIEYYPDNKKKYDGTFLAGKYSGNGILYFENQQSQYEGQFDSGKYSGQGVLYNDNGKKVYEGSFSNGLYKGDGKEYFDSGTVKYSGNFDLGSHSGSGILYDVNQNIIYEGAFVDGLYHGQGKEYENGKPLYEGDFVKGKYQGKGKKYDPLTGSLLYDGEFLEGKYNGNGLRYNQAGKVIYDGAFANDEINYGYLLSLPVKDVTKALGMASEASIQDGTDWFTLVSQDLKISVYLNYNSTSTDYEAQELTVWGEQSVFGILPGSTIDEITQELGSPVNSDWGYVQEQDNAALDGLALTSVYTVEYAVDGYLVTFCSDSNSGKWLYADIEMDSSKQHVDIK